MLTGRNLLFAALAFIALAVSVSGFIVYDNVTTPDDNAFAIRVASENMATQLEQGCQYDSAARSGAAGGTSSVALATPVRPSTGANVPVPIATAIAVTGTGAGSAVNLALTSTSGSASVKTPCRADAIPAGTTVGP